MAPPRRRDAACEWVATLIAFRRQRPLAGALLPYLARVSFAAVLCHVTWQLNPQLL
jgi:tryptophan-rich sensory protein